MSVAETFGFLALVLLLAGVFGGAMAAAFRSPVRRKVYEREVVRFRQGEGSDPDRMSFGYHKTFAHNFRVFTAAGVGFGLAFLTLKMVAG